MITVLLRSTRKQSRIFTPLLVIKRAVGGPLEQLGVLHITERVVMAATPLLMMTTLRITELRTGRERAPTESQMITVQMMRRRLSRRRRHLQFSTHLREDSQLTIFTLVCLRCIAPRYPTMLLE